MAEHGSDSEEERNDPEQAASGNHGELHPALTVSFGCSRGPSTSRLTGTQWHSLPASVWLGRLDGGCGQHMLRDATPAGSARADASSLPVRE